MMRKIADNVYAETGFRGCNPGFVVTCEGVVMIDTPMMPEDAIKWRDEIAKYGEARYLINTEPHGDHFAGNYFFDAIVMAHEGTREAILASKADIKQLNERLKQEAPEVLPHMDGFYYRAPDVTFFHQLNLYVGGHSIHLINLPGHTPCQVAVHIPEEGVVFTSDNVFCGVQAWLHQALPYEWLDSLRKIEALDANVLVPGHGNICDKSYIPEMSSFIQEWIDAVKKAIENGMSLEEAQKNISFSDRYPMEAGSESMARNVQNWNVTRLYEALKG